jgi:hypothetical protein
MAIELEDAAAVRAEAMRDAILAVCRAYDETIVAPLPGSRRTSAAIARLCDKILGDLQEQMKVALILAGMEEALQ